MKKFSFLRGRKRQLAPLAAALSLTLMSSAGGVVPQQTGAIDSPLFGPTPLPAANAAAPDGAEAATPFQVDEQGRLAYVILLRDLPLGSYDGNVAGLRKAPLSRSAGGRERLDTQSAEAKAYVQYLRNEQGKFLADAATRLGRSVHAIEQFQYALNGVIAYLTESEVAKLHQLPAIQSIQPKRIPKLQTFATPAFVGAPAMWHPQGPANPTGYRGEGIVIAVIDTGVNPYSHSFRATGADGYAAVNPLGPGNYLGECAPGGFAIGLCNDKLIGIVLPDAVEKSFDLHGHGSHTASTSGGGFVESPQALSGIAPHAAVIAYTACPGSGGQCPKTLEMIERVVADGAADVINYSIGGPNAGPYLDPEFQAFLAATEAGIFVAQAAGNDGPSDNTTDSWAPWTTTVGSSVPGSLSGYSFSAPGLASDIPIIPSAVNFNVGVVAESPLIESPTFGDPVNDGCSTYPANTFKRPQTATGAGAIAVIHMPTSGGACLSAVRGQNARAAGATGLVFVAPTRLNIGADGPSYAMLESDWSIAKAALGNVSGTGTAVATLGARRMLVARPDADRMSYFSSNGPSPWGTLKPDISAPGTDIFAALSPKTVEGYQGVANQAAAAGKYGPMSGTSMASPHVAGAAALVRQAFPGWTPMEVKSALMMSAKRVLRHYEADAPEIPNRRGAGRLDLNDVLKTGLVLNETAANFRASDPALMGTPAYRKPSALNLASYYDEHCGENCAFTRTFRSTGKATTWNVSVEGLPAGSYRLDRPSFHLSATGLANLTLNIDHTRLAVGQWFYGDVVLTPADSSLATARLPIALRSGHANLTTTSSNLRSILRTGTSADATLTLSNLRAGTTASWSVVASRMRGNLLQRPKLELDAGEIAAGTFGGIPGTDNFTTSADPTAIESSNPTNSYVSDSFEVLVDGVRLTGLEQELGWAGSAAESKISQFTWRIWADAGGKPAGRPGSTVAGDVPPLFVHAATPAGLGVTLNMSVPTSSLTYGARLDLPAAGLTSPLLTRGNYWFNAVATSSETNLISTNTALGSWVVGIPPTGLRSTPNSGQRGWLPIAGERVPAMTIEAEVPCGAPWLSVETSSGALAPDRQTSLRARIDATALAPGRHDAYLCVSSNGTSREYLNQGSENLLLPVSVFVLAADAAGLDVRPIVPPPVSPGDGTTLGVAVGVGGSPLAGSEGMADVRMDLSALGAAANTQLLDGLNDDGIYEIAHTVRPDTVPGTYRVPLTVRAGAFTRLLTVDVVVVPPSPIAATAAPVIANAGTEKRVLVDVTRATGPLSTELLVSADLRAFGVPAQSTAFSAMPEGTRFSYLLVIPPWMAPGDYPVTVTVVDKQARRGTATLMVTVQGGTGDDRLFANGFEGKSGTATAPTISAALDPAEIGSLDLSSTLTLTLANTAPTDALLTASLVGLLPDGLTLTTEPAAASTTCPGGTVGRPGESGRFFDLNAGAQIPAQGSCTVKVTMKASRPGGFVFEMPAGSLRTTVGSNAAAASTTLTVTAVVGFAPYCGNFMFSETQEIPPELMSALVSPYTRVEFAGISSTAVRLRPEIHQNFLGMPPARVTAGQTYPIRLQAAIGTHPEGGSGRVEQAHRVFIDWNRDGAFDASETWEVLQPLPTEAVTIKIPVPASAPAGRTRLRLIKTAEYFLDYSEPRACQAPLMWGAVEDYNVDVSQP